MDLIDLAYAVATRARPALARLMPTLAGAAMSAMAALVAPNTALADKISNPVAVFDGLDKITGRIISFEVAVNETVQFGALQITPRVCYSRPPTDAPQTDAFAQVDEIDEQKQIKRIFSGWMFAASPGLHAVEHPIYDVWLTGCKGGSTVVADTAAPGPTQAAPSGTGKPAAGQQRTQTSPAGTPGATAAAAPTAPARQAPARQQTAPQAQPPPDSMQPLPPPPGSTPVQWPPRR